MGILLIIIGVCFIVAGFKYRSEEKKRNNFEDYVWFHFDDHGWNDDKRKKKKK